MAPRRFLLLHPAEAGTLDALTRDVAPVAAILGVDAYTARQRLVGTGIQWLDQADDRVPLEERAAQLDALGLRVAVYDCADEARLDPVRVRGLSDDGRSLVFHGLEEVEVGRLEPGQRLLGVPLYVRAPDELLRGRPHPEALSQLSAVDLLDESGRWFRVVPHGFNYAGLGEARTPAVGLNLKALLERVSAVAEVTWHLGFPANFGRPVDAEQAERYPRRVWWLWRAGRLGGRDPILDDRPEHRQALAMSAGVDANVLGAVPLRRRRIGPLASRWMRAENVWALLGGALVAFRVLAEGAVRGLRGVPAGYVLGPGLLAFGVACVWYAVRQLRRWQGIADTPTSKIRSVAMGPAELKGTVELDRPLPAPYSKLPCAWYEFRLERLTEVKGGRRFSFVHGLLAKQYVAEAPKAWALVIEGDSAGLPFWLRDETGIIRVEPDGATWHLARTDVHQVESHGVQYRVTERVLVPGASLYVLGHVARMETGPEREAAVVEALRRLKQDPQALARYDVDGNGRIDDGEWDLARRAVRADVEARLALRAREDTVYIGRGPGNEELLISDSDEVKLAMRLRVWAWMGLVVGVLALAYGGALLAGGR